MSDAINIIIAIGMICGVFLVRAEAQQEHRGAFYEPPAQGVITRYATTPEAPPTMADAQAVSEAAHSQKHHGNLTVMQLLNWRH